MCRPLAPSDEGAVGASRLRERIPANSAPHEKSTHLLAPLLGELARQRLRGLQRRVWSRVQKKEQIKITCHCEERSDVAIRSPCGGSMFSRGVKGMRIATTGVRTGLAMTAGVFMLLFLLSNGSRPRLATPFPSVRTGERGRRWEESAIRQKKEQYNDHVTAQKPPTQENFVFTTDFVPIPHKKTTQSLRIPERLCEVYVRLWVRRWVIYIPAPLASSRSVHSGSCAPSPVCGRPPEPRRNVTAKLPSSLTESMI